MPLPHLATLYGHYGPLLNSVAVGTEFSSHWFIERLAQAHQNDYITALIQYHGQPDPFRQLHAPLSQRLYEFPTLIQYVRHDTSPDIFGDDCSNAFWVRI